MSAKLAALELTIVTGQQCCYTFYLTLVVKISRKYNYSKNIFNKFMVQRLGHHDGMRKKKKTGSIWDVDMEKYGTCEMDRQKLKNAVALERVEKERIMLELIKKRKRNCLGNWLRRNCLLKDALEHGCANHNTEGKRFKSPIHCCDVTMAPYLFSGELCTCHLHCKLLFVYIVCCRRAGQCFSVCRTRKSDVILT